MQKKIAEVQMIAKRSEREIADFELTRRKVTAPSTGFVETRIAQLGEWVQPGSPIATVIQMDKLRVEGDVDGLHSIRVHQGDASPSANLQRIRQADPDQRQAGLCQHGNGLEPSVSGLGRNREQERSTTTGSIKPGMQADIVIKPAAQVF